MGYIQRVTYQLLYAKHHNDAGGWQGWVAITNDALKLRKIIEFQSS